MRILSIFLLFVALSFGDDFEEGFKAFAIDDTDTAYSFFKKGAAKRDKRAIYYMGYIEFYSQGKFEDGMETMRRAANMNYPEACYMLGTIYYKTGKFETARKWLKKGARLKHPKSIYLLGYMFEIGAGVKKSRGSANYWYRKIGL